LEADLQSTKQLVEAEQQRANELQADLQSRYLHSIEQQKQEQQRKQESKEHASETEVDLSFQKMQQELQRVQESLQQERNKTKTLEANKESTQKHERQQELQAASSDELKQLRAELELAQAAREQALTKAESLEVQLEQANKIAAQSDLQQCVPNSTSKESTQKQEGHQEPQAASSDELKQLREELELAQAAQEQALTKAESLEVQLEQTKKIAAQSDVQQCVPNSLVEEKQKLQEALEEERHKSSDIQSELKSAEKLAAKLEADLKLEKMCTRALRRQNLKDEDTAYQAVGNVLLQAIDKAPEKDRAKTKKQLLLCFHPDKNPATELANRITQLINCHAMNSEE